MAPTPPERAKTLVARRRDARQFDGGAGAEAVDRYLDTFSMVGSRLVDRAIDRVVGAKPDSAVEPSGDAVDDGHVGAAFACGSSAQPQSTHLDRHRLVGRRLVLSEAVHHLRERTVSRRGDGVDVLVAVDVVVCPDGAVET
ncbi:MAG: hypothetical protein A07HB70_00695 [uncultured archaeon A07HB70]|nr:MAG: hypothetical protein A07HB70_00695 [uncultured archaeon A07HB70]